MNSESPHHSGGATLDALNSTLINTVLISHPTAHHDAIATTLVMTLVMTGGEATIMTHLTSFPECLTGCSSGGLFLDDLLVDLAEVLQRRPGARISNALLGGLLDQRRERVEVLAEFRHDLGSFVCKARVGEIERMVIRLEETLKWKARGDSLDVQLVEVEQAQLFFGRLCFDFGDAGGLAAGAACLDGSLG